VSIHPTPAASLHLVPIRADQDTHLADVRITAASAYGRVPPRRPRRSASRRRSPRPDIANKDTVLQCQVAAEREPTALKGSVGPAVRAAEIDILDAVEKMWEIFRQTSTDIAMSLSALVMLYPAAILKVFADKFLGWSNKAVAFWHVYVLGGGPVAAQSKRNRAAGILQAASLHGTVHSGKKTSPSLVHAASHLSSARASDSDPRDVSDVAACVRQMCRVPNVPACRKCAKAYHI